ncbi:MAG TPA: DUF2066 domain-containing protein [Gammaproteobacteria bacterium]|nr:DUF2066 domain-containing protein [Gammaproteobacteria bacterium]
MDIDSALRRAATIVLLAAHVAVLPVAFAATVQGLYSVTVPRDPAASDRRAAAERAAMAGLLVRVTGSRATALDPAVQPLLAAPREYVLSYGELPGGSYRVEFRRAPVENALRALGVRVWGAERPLTLLWVAIDDGAGGRALLGANETTELGAVTPRVAAMLKSVREEIDAAAEERGLPIALPLLDLADQSAVTFQDVWGGFEGDILAASARYRADAVLIGRVRPGAFGNEVDWLFVNGIERSGLPLGAVRDGLDAAADRYAAELGTVGGASLTSLTVHNVQSSADYSRVMSYLEQQSVLERIDVESFGNGTLTLRVAARGDALVLGRVLALGGVLRPAAFGSGQLAFEVVGNGPAP